MKTLVIGAAGLLLSGTALAAVGAKNAEPLDGSMIHNAMLIDWPAKRMDAQPASLDTSKDFDLTSKQVTEVAMAEIPSTTAMTKADTLDGVGGPDEPEAVATTVAAPATSYPACSPGPGDDNCIQLYEPGVAESYAAWQAGHGVPGTEQTAMGGPEEPVEGTGVMPAASAADYPVCRSRSDDRCIQPGEHETLAAVENASVNEQLAMGGPEEAIVEPASAESDELAAYEEPLPEDLVLPASEELAWTDAPTRSGDAAMAL